MIYGKKHRIVNEFKEEGELISTEAKIISKILKDLEKNKIYILTVTDIDCKTETVYKKVKVRNKQLKVGDKIFVCRWDGNGISEEQTIENFEIHDKNTCIINTKNGFAMFRNLHKDNYHQFTWKGGVNKWTKEYMTLTYLPNVYIKI